MASPTETLGPAPSRARDGGRWQVVRPITTPGCLLAIGASVAVAALSVSKTPG